MKNIIYLDNAATSIVNDDVLKTFNDVINTYKGNASSIHSLGVESSHLIYKAKNNILNLFSLTDFDVIFTSGATEANNLAIKGIAFNYQNRGKHLITSKVEHPSVLETFRQLEKDFGFEVTYLNVNEKGIVDINELKSSIRKDTILVSIMGVNNETGAINNIEEIALLLKEYPKIYFHSDMVQGIGKVRFDFSNLDLITYTAHKIHGLVGIGALIKRKNISLYPINTGGGQENNERSGTYNVPMIVSFAKATRLAFENLTKNKEYVLSLFNILKDYFNSHLEDYEINALNDKNPYIVNVSLKNKKAAVVVEGLSKRGIMISSISACHSKGESISYVINEMKHDEKIAHNTLRISLDINNTKEDIETFIKNLDEIIKEIK